MSDILTDADLADAVSSDCLPEGVAWMLVPALRYGETLEEYARRCVVARAEEAKGKA